MRPARSLVWIPQHAVAVGNTLLSGVYCNKPRSIDLDDGPQHATAERNVLQKPRVPIGTRGSCGARDLTVRRRERLLRGRHR